MRLKEIYNLSYDSSGLESGLIKWYDRLIDKTYNQLDAVDVSKMLRQNLLVEVANKRIVDLFLSDPYDGEFEVGGLLSLLLSLDVLKIEHSTLTKLKQCVETLNTDYLKFDWQPEEEEIKEQYKKNINEMLVKLRL